MTTKKNMGRPKGSLDMRSRNVRQAIQMTGMTPLEYMLEVMRDENEERPLRLQAANNAAKFCHPALAQTQLEVTGDITYDKIEREIVKPKPTNG
jgi:hypothetical protein